MFFDERYCCHYFGFCRPTCRLWTADVVVFAWPETGREERKEVGSDYAWNSPGCIRWRDARASSRAGDELDSRRLHTGKGNSWSMADRVRREGQALGTALLGHYPTVGSPQKVVDRGGGLERSCSHSFRNPRCDKRFDRD